MSPVPQAAVHPLSALPRLTARSLGHSLLAQDALFPRIPVQARSAMVDAALGDGSAKAEAIARQFGTDPWVIAAWLGVAIVRSDADASFGSVIVFAEYTATPACITLYRKAIAAMNRLLAHPSLRVLGAGDCERTALAHELYHHLAHMLAQPMVSRRYRVEQFRVGRWRWSSGVAALEEIAAGAFAKTLLGLKFHPRLHELLYALGDPAPRDSQAQNTLGGKRA